MDRVELDIPSASTIEIQHVKGSLRLKGWDRPAFRADCDKEDAHTIEQTDDNITISSTSGCMLRVPMESNLKIGKIDGDLMIKSAEGQFTGDFIGGQIMAKSVGSLVLAEVRGNINARNIEGDFSCQDARGNVNIQDIEGAITIPNAKGNLLIKGYCGGITAQTNGNATLRMETCSDGSYHIKANGNITCRLMPEISATISMKSGAEVIKIKQEQEVKLLKNAEHELVAGDGSTKIFLEAGANIDLTIPGEDEFDWDYELDIGEDLAAMAEDISSVVTEQLETQLDALGEHLSNLSDNLSSLNPEISEKTRARIEAKRAKLERKLAKVERRAAEKARQSSRRISRRYNVNLKQSDPVSDEERQKVLEMLQNKLISVEDAEALLAALEGQN